MKAARSLVLALASLCFAQVVSAQQNGLVLLVPREQTLASDFMIEKELGVIATTLNQAGYGTEVATLSGRAIKGQRLSVPADLKIAEVDLSRYKAVVLACMAAGPVDAWHASMDEMELVRKAEGAGLLVAAQSSALITLAEAGLLDGRKFCYYLGPSLLNASFSRGIHSGLGVVQDGNIICSSSCPYVPVEYGIKWKDYTPQFAAAIVSALAER